MYLPIRTDGGAATAGTLTYSRVGVYEYELRCVTDASGVEGLKVDETAYSVRVAIENDDVSGLRVGWIEVKNLSTEKKPEVASFEHSYVGGAVPTPAPEEPKPQPTLFGMKLPKTGDSTWGLIQLSGLLCVMGIVAVGLGIPSCRRKGGKSSRS